MKMIQILMLLLTIFSDSCFNATEKKTIIEEDDLDTYIEEKIYKNLVNIDSFPPSKDYEIKYIETKTNYQRYCSRIDFIEKITGKVANSFDIAMNNPFSISTLENKKTKLSGQYLLNQYNLTGVDKKIFKDIIPQIFYDSLKYEHYTEGYTTVSIWREGKNYTSVTYTFNLRDFYCSVGLLTKIFIINNKGIVIRELLIDENSNVGTAAISENGRFLCFRYSDISCEGDVPNGGIKLVDLLNFKKINFEYPYPQYVRVSKPLIIKEKILYKTEIYREGQVYYNFFVIDSNTEEIYSKVYSENEVAGNVKWEEDGVVFLTKEKKRKDFFTKSFLKEKLKFVK